VYDDCAEPLTSVPLRAVPTPARDPAPYVASSPIDSPARAEWAPVNALVAAYLAASALPLSAAVLTGRASAARLAAHLAFLLLTAWGARRGVGRASPALQTVAAWTPLLLVPAFYNELPHVAAGLGTRMHDAPVIRWELALFGDSPARTFAAAMPWRALSELLHAGYLSYYALIVGPPLVFWAMGRRRAFAESAFAVMLAFVCCYCVFVAFPVQGPWFEWPIPAAIPRGPVREAVERLLLAGSSRGTAFPSSHVAVSVAQTLATWRLLPPLGWACAACTVALSLGAVYGGLHYAIDVLVGAGVGAVVGLLGPRVVSRSYGSEGR
jgi:membrane-associated phospholipid phosphatase